MQTAKELLQKVIIFFQGICLMSFITLIYLIAANFYKWPSPLKAIELAAIESHLDDVNYAMSAAQEDILELHNKIKKGK